MTWWLITLPLAAFLLWRWKVAGPGPAIGESVIWGLLVPTWIVLPIAGLPFDILSAIACFGLLMYCVHPDALFRTSLTVNDAAVLAIFGVHIISDSLAEGFNFGIPCRAYGEWIVPYLAGRVSVRDATDLRALRSTVCVVAIVLGIWSATEAIGGFNPINSIVGQRPADNSPFYNERWGLKRAEGPTIHPIWLGMIQALLLPWTLSAANSALAGRTPRWQILALICSVFGVFFSLSRGPWGLVVLTLYGAATCRLKQARKALILVGAVLLLTTFVMPDTAMEGLQALTSQDHSNADTVTVDDEKVKLDATSYRVVLFDIYGEAMRRAGWIGFGTDRTTGFPVRVPLGTLDPKATKKVPSIDNAYILMQLRFGLLGVVSLIAILGSAAIIAIYRALRPGEQSGVFHASIGSMLLSLIVVLMAEYIPRDYGFLLFWSLGTVSGFGAFKSPTLDFPKSKRSRRSSA